MAPTTKLPTKPILIASMNTNPIPAPKPNICQNPTRMDTTNPANQPDFAIDSNGKKTIIIVIYSNIEGH